MIPNQGPDAPVIDLSALPEPVVENQISWDPPKHTYFGKRLPDGKMTKEPVYTHQEYPRVVYTQDGPNELRAHYVESDEQLEAIEGWRANPGEFGVFTAPSQEQLQAQREARRRREAGEPEPEPEVEVKPRGRRK